MMTVCTEKRMGNAAVVLKGVIFILCSRTPSRLGLKPCQPLSELNVTLRMLISVPAVAVKLLLVTSWIRSEQCITNESPSLDEIDPMRRCLSASLVEVQSDRAGEGVSGAFEVEKEGVG
ncbi:hypothetical protein WG66_007835 [Moniliophthora roreri]|nr:hypothetical protein WG66_007835 [Moniliophthora roreri]